MEEPKIIDFEIQHPFQYEYQPKGESGRAVEAKTIRLSAFTMKQMDKVLPVKEIVMKALGKLIANIDITAEDAEEAKEKREQAKKDAENVDSGEFMTIMAMHCDSGDLLKLHLHMKALLSCGVAYVNQEAELKNNLIDRMDPSDFDALCGEYIGNFIT